MKKIALYESSGKPEAVHWAEYSANKLLSQGAVVGASETMLNSFKSDLKNQIVSLGTEDYEKFSDIVISFGGDGTMLGVARLLLGSEIPIMGVNVGRLGFLAEFSVNSLDESLQNIMNGNYRMVDRAVLETEIEGETLYALNDFVLEKRETSHMITMKAYTNGHYIGDYRADGLIITTPTGSTAYSLSCGGPIISPSARVFCITPISPHSLNFRPLVLPDTNDIKLQLFATKSGANLVTDGQVVRTLGKEDAVTIRLSGQIIKLIKPPDSSYYDLLRAKLLWAVNASDINHSKK